MRYGKVVTEFFRGSGASDTSLLSMLIHVDKHPDLDFVPGASSSDAESSSSEGSSAESPSGGSRYIDLKVF